MKPSDARVTLNEQVEALPDASVAVHVIVVSPTGKLEPEGGLQFTEGAVSQLSPLVTEKATGTNSSTLHGAVMSAGQISVGG